MCLIGVYGVAINNLGSLIQTCPKGLLCKGPRYFRFRDWDNLVSGHGV